LSPVLLSAQEYVKIVIPPLPRYVFNTCCAKGSHCTNFQAENYAEKNLNGVTRLRGILKKEVKDMGVQKYWILDGIGSVTGVPPGTSIGANREALSELKTSLASDGVHLSPTGYRHLANSIELALTSLRTGKLKKDAVSGPNAVSGDAAHATKKQDFYWRGFSSPNGDKSGREAHIGGCGGVRPERGRGKFHSNHSYHPYAGRGGRGR
jgi:hypothetical protein